jgi:hypothetical protein
MSRPTGPRAVGSGFRGAARGAHLTWVVGL